MNPTWQTDDGAIRLYLADCLDVLPALTGVDAVVTDPPYGIQHVTSHGASWEGTQIAGDQDCTLRDAVLSWAADKPWACWGSYKTASPANFKAKIVWDKGPAFGAGDLRFPWKPSFEECWFSRGPWHSDYRDEGVWRGPVVVSWETVAGGRVHPHQKPEWLFVRIIEALPTCDTILDPFMGSGTTGVACIRTGRKFIGIEKEPKYFEIAVKRIEGEIRKNGFAWQSRNEPRKQEKPKPPRGFLG